MNIAIIPARGGSKRIPRKNIKLFSGKPIIAWSIEAAKKSALFDHVVVSTEDAEIAEVAKRLGAEVPFVRPMALSGDGGSTDSVLLHAVAQCEAIYGPISYGCCIYPTSPLLAADDLAGALRLLQAHQATSAFPVVKFDFPIEQAFVLDGVRPRAKWPEKMLAMSQDLDDHFHDAGMFYWFDARKYLAARELFSSDAVTFQISAHRCQDINTFDDWTRAEIKHRILLEDGVK